MISNLEKYKQDLARLIDKGERLLDSIEKKYESENQSATDRNKSFSYNLFDEWKSSFFRDEYQSWYSESLVMIKQLISDRKSNFIRYYEQSKIYNSIESYLVEWNPLSPEVILRFQQQLAILKAAERRFESSLFDIKQLLQADVFDNELNAATELNKKGFARGAGAITGVVLEGHLKEICNKRKIEIKKTQPTINDLNKLLRDNEVIDTPTWRNIQRLADLRNLCVHKRDSEPTKEKISEFIEGVEKIIKTLF